MIQVATFSLPDEQAQANEFFATHKPAGDISFNAGMLYVFYDDGRVSPAYEIAEYEDMVRAVKAAKRQQEIALFTMQNERDTLNAKHNKGRYEQLSHSMKEVQDALKLQDYKLAFLEGRIAELRSQYGAEANQQG